MVDFFRKLPQELQISTSTGFLTTILSSCVICFMIYYEVQAYMQPIEQAGVVLDHHQEDHLRIDFNLSFPSLPCAYATVDVSDHMGQKFSNLTHNIRRWRLTQKQGHLIQQEEIKHKEPEYIEFTHPGQEFAEILDASNFDDFMMKYEMVLVNFFAPWCPYCRMLEPVWEYVAGQMLEHPEYSEKVMLAKVDCTLPASKPLCKRAFIHAFPTVLIYMKGSTTTRYMYSGPRTPNALMLFIDVFYKRFFSSTPDDEIPEDIAAETQILNTISKRDGAEGCRLVGTLGLHRVPGKLSFTAHSPGHTFDVSAIDVSHIIHRMKFGQPIPRKYTPMSKKYMPLNGQKFQTSNQNITIEHYIKVIGIDTFLTKGQGVYSHVRHYEFSSNSNKYNATGSMPAALFTFDISPLVIERRTEWMPFFRFCINLCAVVGGTFTILGLADSVLYHAANSIRRKQQLGKLN